MLRNVPIQRKIMSVVMLTCMSAILLMCTAYISYEYFSYRTSLREQVKTIAAIVASNSSAALAFDSPKDANEILNAFRADTHIRSACIYDAEGRLFAKYPQWKNSNEFPRSPENDGYNFKNSLLTGFEAIIQEDNRLGTLYIQSDMDALYEQIRQYVLIALILIICCLFVAYQFSKLLQKSIAKPVLELQQTAKIVSDYRDYSVRAVKTGNDELGSLTDAFNHMLAQIHHQNKEITSFNQKLESKVNERTAELNDANKILLQQKEFVETIINSTVDLVAVIDKDLKYVLINKKVNELYNVRNEDILNRRFDDVFPDVKNTPMVEYLDKALKGEEIHVTRYKSPVLNRYFENFYIPLKDINGSTYGVLAIGHDITSVMETQEKLQNLNDELVKSNRDLEQFAYVASHDLQEPLRKIQTFTQLVAQHSNDPEQVIKYHQKIYQSANRMQQLIRDVLNFSRISKSEDAFTETDLNVVLKNLRTDFELLISETEAKISYPSLPVINGIPLQITQLFSNLISNSLKYTSGKPEINISWKKLSNDEVLSYKKLNGTNDYIRLEFADNGIGFEQQFSEQIFDIFQRLHGRQKYSGTGIGLALCKKIVENHHGIITADSEPGKGAKFTVILPGYISG